MAKQNTISQASLQLEIIKAAKKKQREAEKKQKELEQKQQKEKK